MMCGPDAYQVEFSPNQALPHPYGVEGCLDLDGTSRVFWAYYDEGQWIGPNRSCRYKARKDAIDHFRAAEQ